MNKVKEDAGMRSWFRRKTQRGHHFGDCLEFVELDEVFDMGGWGHSGHFAFVPGILLSGGNDSDSILIHHLQR